jgi:hypothetical protein
MSNRKISLQLHCKDQIWARVPDCKSKAEVAEQLDKSRIFCEWNDLELTFVGCWRTYWMDEWMEVWL